MMYFRLHQPCFIFVNLRANGRGVSRLKRVRKLKAFFGQDFRDVMQRLENKKPPQEYVFKGVSTQKNVGVVYEADRGSSTTSRLNSENGMDFDVDRSEATSTFNASSRRCNAGP